MCLLVRDICTNILQSVLFGENKTKTNGFSGCLLFNLSKLDSFIHLPTHLVTRTTSCSSFETLQDVRLCLSQESAWLNPEPCKPNTCRKLIKENTSCVRALSIFQEILS